MKTKFLAIIIVFLFVVFAGCKGEQKTEHKHSYDDGVVIVEASCTEDGKKVFTCTVCHETKEKKVKAKHDLVIDVQSLDNCENGGEARYVCSICDETIYVEIPPSKHEWLEANCTEPKRCKNCCVTEGDYPDGHKYGGWQYIDPTPTSVGKKTHICTVCGEAEEKEIGLSGFYNANSSGYYSGHYYCKDFNGTLIDSECIFNKYGEIEYLGKENEEILFCGGEYFYSKLNGTISLKKHDGTVIFTPGSLEASDFGLCYNYDVFQSFLQDGYVFVYKMTETYSSVTYEIGIIDVNGNWIVPLSSDNPIITSGMKLGAEAFRKEIYYLGEGMLLIPVNENGYDYKFKLYSIKDNKVYEFVCDEGYEDQIDCIAPDIEFKNGIYRTTYTSYWSSNPYLFEIKNNGIVNVTSLQPKDSGTIMSFYGCYVDEKGNYTTLSSNGWYSELRTNGYLVKSLEDSGICDITYVGGMWLVAIENSAGSKYYTFLLPDGTYIFEPVKSNSNIYLEDGSNVSCGESSNIIIDKQGKVLFETERTNYKLTIKNGIAREYLKEYVRDDKYVYTMLPK